VSALPLAPAARPAQGVPPLPPIDSSRATVGWGAAPADDDMPPPQEEIPAAG
jgi:hypothetical protein